MPTEHIQTLFHTQKPIPFYCIHPAPQWAPLALGLILSYAAEQLSPQIFDTRPRFIANIQEADALMGQSGPGICLFSNYMWTRTQNLEISRYIRQNWPESLIIHGGPDTPAYAEACREFLQQNPDIDFTVYGEGEQTVVELVQTLSVDPAAVAQVAGLAFIQDQALVKTPARPRAQDLNIYPSPYLNGLFEQIDYQQWNSAALESNRGCPYGCTFCDWGSATLQKIRCFDFERVTAEIEWLARHQIAEFWITDANFGIFERDVEITRVICQMRRQYGYPHRLITNYAKNTKKYLVEIIELLVEAGLLSTGIVSLQTHDPLTLEAVKRTNIKLTEYEKLRETFARKNLPLSTQLMIGLPGSTPESFQQDLRFCFYQDIDVQIFRTVVLPNSPMADPDYRATWQIEYDAAGMILSTRDLSPADMAHIEQLARLFRCSHAYGMLKYFQSWLDWTHGIDPILFLDRLLRDLPGLTGYQWLPQLYDRVSPPFDMINTHFELRETLRRTAAWSDFYAELGHYTRAVWPQVRADAEFELVMRIQTALMPAAGRVDPMLLALEHDFVTYYWDHCRQLRQAALSSYGSARLEIKDPLMISETVLQRGPRPRGRVPGTWELYSSLLGTSREQARNLIQSA
jgi:radical SAM superfamily enzyme YgiQ (UPF0313 family)